MVLLMPLSWDFNFFTGQTTDNRQQNQILNPTLCTCALGKKKQNGKCSQSILNVLMWELNAIKRQKASMNNTSQLGINTLQGRNLRMQLLTIDWQLNWLPKSAWKQLGKDSTVNNMKPTAQKNIPLIHIKATLSD